MKRFIQIVIAVVLLGSITIQAEPILQWLFVAPTEYENDQPITPNDLHSWKLLCGMQDGGPYPAEKLFTTQAPGSASLDDMDFVVAGVPGEYFCVSTVSSFAYLSESGYSNQINFTVLPGDLGFVPKPPVLSLQ